MPSILRSKALKVKGVLRNKKVADVRCYPLDLSIAAPDLLSVSTSRESECCARLDGHTMAIKFNSSWGIFLECHLSEPLSLHPRLSSSFVIWVEIVIFGHAQRGELGQGSHNLSLNKFS